MQIVEDGLNSLNLSPKTSNTACGGTRHSRRLVAFTEEALVDQEVVVEALIGPRWILTMMNF